MYHIQSLFSPSYLSSNYLSVSALITIDFKQGLVRSVKTPTSVQKAHVAGVENVITDITTDS
jgi:hypothetical protein